MQGGGIRTYYGTATINNCNIYNNTAQYVRSLALELCRHFLEVSPIAPMWDTSWTPSERFLCVAQGGGLYIYGSSTVATITNCNIHNNNANYKVRSLAASN